MLQLKIEDLELMNQDLVEQMDQSKLKARGLLMRKEITEKRLKTVVAKLESYLKSEAGGKLN